MIIRTLIGVVLVLFASLPASAYTACISPEYRTSPTYRAAFDPRLTDGIFCAARSLNNLEINGRTTPVRVIRFDTGFDAADDVWIGQINDVIDRISFAATALNANLRIQPVSVLLSNRQRVDLVGEVRTPVHGAATSGALTGECPITIYKLRSGVSNAEFGQTFAHEIFHCIQFSTWPEKVNSDQASWWMEGSAEYFGALVVPEDASAANSARDFGERSQQQGLNQLEGADNSFDYENVAFFSWLHQQGGGEAAGQFLVALPAAGTLASLQSVLPVSRWAAFTESLIKGDVALPSGSRVAAGAELVVLELLEDENTVDVQTDAYRTYRVAVEFPNPGEYEISLDAPGTIQSRIRLGEGEWQDLPATVRGCRNDPKPVFYAVTTEGPQDLAITYRRTADCSPCEAVSTVDSCLVGTWTWTGGGPLEYMRSMGMPDEFAIDVSEVSMQMLRNGTYIMANPVSTTASHVDDIGRQWDGAGQMVNMSGEWAAAEGVLYTCPLSGRISSEVTIDGASAMNMMQGPGGNMQVPYTCAGNTLSTTIDIPGMPPMETTYTRQ